jgi:uncharacterized protein YigA (DUF484 family)
MSTQRNPEYPLDANSDEAVHDYLKNHPDFFERHDDLLSALRLPHVTGATVSLVERQVSALRQKDMKLERRLKELMDVARANDALTQKIHSLAIKLLAAGTLVDTLSACEKSLRTAFDADQAVLVLFRDPALFGEVNVGRFFRPLEKDAAGLKPFDSFLSRGKPRCGQVRDTQRDFLFGEETDEIGSCALVPLGKQCELGFLAIGSSDVDRFHPAMSIDFITRLGELLAAALRRF